EPVGRSVTGPLLDRLACKRAIVLGDRARDPRHVVVRDQAAEGGYETASPARRRPVSVRVASKRHGAAIRDDDQLPAHAAEAYPAMPRPKRRRARYLRCRSRAGG